MRLTLDHALLRRIQALKVTQLWDTDRYYTAILKAILKPPDDNHNTWDLQIYKPRRGGANSCFIDGASLWSLAHIPLSN